MPVEQALKAILFVTLAAAILLLPVPHEVGVERLAAAHVPLLAQEAHVLAFLEYNTQRSSIQ